MKDLLDPYTFLMAVVLVFAGCDASPITPPPTDGGTSRAGFTPHADPPIERASGAMVAAGGLNLSDVEVADDAATSDLEGLVAGNDRCDDQGLGSEPAGRNIDQQRRGGCLAITNGTIVDTPLAETF